ncbi:MULTISPECIES: DoxX family protein [Actinomadura]|uniref:DoxX family protein n=1 Tax=Actinomadura litoris TaxID=2678616 RepID=A0A7K1KZA6_9ACTN|nr:MULTISPECIES: DoxX family protein [Actinomadura]MBT2211972.1 DoxX family protein [Actinomadura sp. NEAU-AAG7]MUN37534.1 DoxX family protein [Actinomadura litoris]
MAAISSSTPATTPASSPATTRGGRRTLRRVLWGAQILLAVFLFAGSALPKFAGQAEAVRTFEEIGWGQWFRYVTGAVEAAGAIGLVVPRLAGLAAVGLIGLMAGAAATQLLVLSAPWAALPAAFAVVFAVIAWDRRAETGALLRAPRR